MSLSSELSNRDPKNSRLSYNAELSDIIADVNNIVSSDTGEISLAKSFVEEFDFSKEDFDILEGCMRFNSGMTEYQSQHFVVDQQLTPWRKVRQALMELETRYHAYIENRHSLRKAELLRKKFIRTLQNLEAEGGDEIDA